MALRRVFASTRTSSAEVPPCDVLFLYAHLDEDGRIINSTLTLADLAKAAGAPVVVVASENASERCRAAATQIKRVNLIFAVSRGGNRFFRLLTELFLAMKGGAKIAVALEKGTAQMGQKSGSDPSCPVTVCLMGAGNVKFLS